MLNVIMLKFIMLNIVAPYLGLNLNCLTVILTVGWMPSQDKDW
jgi:hypothetical protein